MIKEDNLIQVKSFEFSIKIIYLYKLMLDKNEYVLSKQILRSATSIGANIEEALAGQSRKDFAAKLAIACKEARETKYWLRLLDKSQLVKFDYSDYLKEIESILNILTKIIKTTNKNSSDI